MKRKIKSRSFRSISAFLALRHLISLGIGLVLVFSVMLELSSAQQQLSQSAIQQIQALMNEKASRTPVQRKISSRLIYALKMKRGQPIAPGLPSLRINLDTDPDGRILVDIKATVTQALLTEIGNIGGKIINSFAKYGAIRARISLEQVEALASSPDVQFIRPAGKAITNKVNTTEGAGAHRADIARSTFGVDGTGVGVGVLSDGVDSLAAIQGSGDLPAGVAVLPGQAGSGDEGTAMLEIVYDVAPGAALSFATAFGGQASFAQNILMLRIAGSDIIVDDVFYFAESPFQDGIIAQAVNAVTAAGALYFSSAGNSGNLNDGTSGVWEGDFLDGGASGIGAGGRIHDFGGGNISNQLTANAPFAVTLFWSDPLGGSGNDYDLYILDSTLTTILDASLNWQNGNDDPFEQTGFALTGERLVVLKWGGSGQADRFLHLNTIRGQLSIATDGQTGGHAATPEKVFGVAAVDADPDNDNVGQPFDSADTIETFSSDGPRRVFYQPDGTPITPGDVSSTGGIVRNQPVIAAADGVATAAPGFNPFFGTSAAAPHAAAIAALLKSANPGLTATDVRTALISTAIDIEGPGLDRDSGYGIIDAFDAIQTASLPPDNVNPMVSYNNGLAVDFGSLGLYYYNGASWSQISTNNAQWLTAYNGNLAADFGSTYGLYQYNGASWSHLTLFASPDNTGNTMVAYNDGLAADFGTSGLYYYNGASWSQISTNNAQWLTAYNGNLAADFGTTYGLYQYDGTTWSQISTSDADNTGNTMVAYNNGLAVDFGSLGIYYYNGAAWSQISTNNAQWLTVYGDKLVADFGSTYGLYRYDGTSWAQISISDADNTGNTMVAYNNGLAVDFGSLGIYYYNGAAWSQISTNDPEWLAVYNGSLAADFGGAFGLYRYDGSAWTQISTSDVDN